MRPLILKGHTRPISQVKFNPQGDLLFSTSADKICTVWYSSNGERLGTYNGHQGAVWSVDVNHDSTLVATGAADDSVRIWDLQTGVQKDKFEFETSIKWVEFSPDGKQLLCLLEQRMGTTGGLVIVSLSEPSKERITIPNQGSRITACGWGYLGSSIIAGHENGSISKINPYAASFEKTSKEHAAQITDLQFSKDRSYFIVSSKDKSAKIFDTNSLTLRKTFTTDTPLNTAAITSSKDFVILGGGQEARDVTTTSERQGRFEARICHAIFGDEIGRIKGHFGPLNSIAIHPKGKAYASGGEDGYVRMCWFDDNWFDFMYEVERNEVRERQNATL